MRVSDVTVSALIRTFAGRHKLPVEVDEVVAALRARDIQDEIYYFWDSGINTGILNGFIQHWDYETGNGLQRCADITYARSTNDQERLVCTKEMLHILDPERALVSSDPAIEALMEKIILPPDLVDYESDGIHALTDRVAVAQALAVLFPFAARAVLLEPYRTKKIDIDVIAELAELPPKYVSAVMNDNWESTHALLVRMDQ